MIPHTSLEDIRECVRKTIDDCLAQVLIDRPAVQLRPQHQLRLDRLVDEISELFLDIRLGSR
jgi:hypothetical protein